jgi:hypothetical protein
VLKVICCEIGKLQLGLERKEALDLEARIMEFEFEDHWLKIDGRSLLEKELDSKH